MTACANGQNTLKKDDRDLDGFEVSAIPPDKQQSD